MPNPDTRILIVDDAKFSTHVINRTLSHAGYQQVVCSASAPEAIKLQREQPFSIIIADWMMPDIDGLQLTRLIRQMDEASNHYTYILMLTGLDSISALQTAFDEGVDDFVNKAHMKDQLLARIYAAERLVDNQNRLLIENERLLKANSSLQKMTTLDTLTGLGNRNFALNRLSEMLRHTDSRGDTSCILVVEISDWDRISNEHPRHIQEELISGAGRRLRSLVRPMDLVCRISDSRFMVLCQTSDTHNLSTGSYKRILDGLALRAFITSTGFHTLKVSISAATADNHSRLPEAGQLLSFAEQALEQAENQGRLVLRAYQAG